MGAGYMMSTSAEWEIVKDIKLGFWHQATSFLSACKVLLKCLVYCGNMSLLVQTFLTKYKNAEPYAQGGNDVHCWGLWWREKENARFVFFAPGIVVWLSGSNRWTWVHLYPARWSYADNITRALPVPRGTIQAIFIGAHESRNASNPIQIYYEVWYGRADWHVQEYCTIRRFDYVSRYS